MRAGGDRGVVSSQSADRELDLRALGLSLWRKKWRVIIPGLIAAALSLFAVNLITPKYKSEARLLIEGRENIFLRPEAERQSPEVRDRVDVEALTSQAQILQSRDVALQVIRELKLNQKPEFDPALRGVSIPSVFLSMLGLGKDALNQTAEERVLTNFYQRLSVLPVDKSRVILIEFQSSDPDLAARVVNAVIDAYFTVQRANKQEQARGASQWLATEIDKLRPKVVEAENAVENFRAKANLFVGTDNSSLSSQQLTELTTTLAGARGQKAELEAKARLIRNMLNSGKPIEADPVTNSDLIRRLVEQRVTLRSQLAEQSSTLLDRHPRIQELKAQIYALDSQIRGEAEKIVHTVENDARIAGARIETTNAAIEQLKKQISGSGGQEVQLRALEREAKAQRDLLESYLAKYREASARDSLDTTSDVRVISRAIPSNVPAFPKKVPIILIATFVTMFLAMSLIVTGDLLRAGERAPAAPADPSANKPARPARPQRTGGGLLGFLRPRAKPAAAVAEPAMAKPAESAPASRVGAIPVGNLALALRRVGEAGRRITVVGVARNVGTTYTALGLSRALVQQGARVVLVDLALESPNIAVLSTDPDAPGVAELIRGDASFGQIVTRDRFSRVHFVAMGKVQGMDASMLASPRLAMTLEALARTYDHVIVDGGAFTDTMAPCLARLTPRAVLVATELEHPATQVARDRLIAAGFIEVTVMLGSPGEAGRGRQPAAA
jgi:succinoglycan biosynthesis transport protein ExoP